MNPHRNVWLPRILALAPLVAAACLSAFLLTGCGEQKAAGPAAPPVEVAKVVVKDVPIVREWVGTTDGLVNAKINAQVQGYLIKQNYKEGSVVKKGQVLFEIDPRPFQAALEQAKGQLAIDEGQTLHRQGQSGEDPAFGGGERGEQKGPGRRHRPGGLGQGRGAGRQGGGAQGRD